MTEMVYSLQVYEVSFRWKKIDKLVFLNSLFALTTSVTGQFKQTPGTDMTSNRLKGTGKGCEHSLWKPLEWTWMTGMNMNDWNELRIVF